MEYPKIAVRHSEVSSWKMYYEHHKDLFLQSHSAEEYDVSMKEHTLLLENWMKKYDLSVVPAVIDLCEQNDDPVFKISIISAGFLMVRVKN